MSLPDPIMLSSRQLDSEQILKNLADKGISIRVASPALVKEEAPESYKDVTEVVNTCMSLFERFTA